jgi:hypothetical protein
MDPSPSCHPYFPLSPLDSYGFNDHSGIYHLLIVFVFGPTPHLEMDPNRQDKTNQKLNSYIFFIHPKVDYINEQLKTRIDEINSTFKQSMEKFLGSFLL